MSDATTAGRPRTGTGLLGVLPDERLARRAVDGDERAFAAIFSRYHQRLYRFCLSIVGNPEDAQDALQNTMVNVLRALPGEQRRIDLKPWLYRIAHNESIEVLRRRRETRELDAELPAPGPGLAEEAGSRERLRRLLVDLDELPERQRETLVMRELAGLEFAEIGAALGTSAAVARQTVYEARLSLRQMDEGREMSCATVTRALSDGDGRVTRRRDVRSHLRACADCRRFREEIEGRRRDLAALSPLPAVAATGLLHALLGHGGGGGGGGLAAGIGGGAAKSVGATAALKGAAAVAVIAAVGVTAADRGGVIDVGLPGGGSATQPVSARPDGASGVGSTRTSGVAGGAVQGSSAASGVGRRARALRGSSGARNTATTGTGTASPAATGGSGDQAEVAAPGSSAAHPHGRDHEKSHPSASQHGQQTAAEHKAAQHGSSTTKGHGGQSAAPAQPAKPPHPSSPGAEKGPPASHGVTATPELPPAGGRSEEATTAQPPPPEEAPPVQGRETPHR